MTPASGVSFNELMIGGFTMGETDPIAGEREGLHSRNFLAIQAFATIPNLTSFVADPNHMGELGGTVHFAPAGDRVRADHGFFQLFVPTPDPRTKLMVYALCFQTQGIRYRLHGRKQVLHRSVLHSWKETTTLYCHLHQGQDERSPVVGAGVLHLTFAQFARQLLSFRTVNANSFSEKVRALTGFGNFFGRELIDSYLS